MKQKGVNPNDVKKYIPERIIAMIKSSSEAEVVSDMYISERAVIAQCSLESGFGNKVIKKILNNMHIVGMIDRDIDTGMVYPGNKMAIEVAIRN